MKTLILTATLTLLASTTFAKGQSPIVAGTYSEKTIIALRFVNDAEDCTKNEGGEYRDETCVVPNENEMMISIEGKVSISVTGNNTNECSFEGQATVKGSLVTVRSTGDAPAETCTLELKKTGPRSVSVKTKNDACIQHCGMGVSLDNRTFHFSHK